MALVLRGNDALETNPPNADRHLTTNGSDWLWACTAVFCVTFLSWLLWTILRRRLLPTTAHHVHNQSAGVAPPGSGLRGERIFHYLFTVAAFVGLIAYFTMASDLGSTPVLQYMNHSNTPDDPTRQIFYARYIYWFVAWPLVLIAVLLLSGVSWATILFAVTILEIWVVSWLCGALVRTSFKWGYFTFGVFAYFVLAYILLSWGGADSRALGAKTSYMALAGLLVLVWMVYPIAWGLSEGSNRLSVTGEMVFYGILDLISVPLYGTLFLVLSRRFDYRSLFSFTQRGRLAGIERDINPSVPVTGHNGV